MLTFELVNDEKTLKRLFSADTGFWGYVAMDNGKPIGSCWFKLNGSFLNIIRINYLKREPSVGEGLTFSAINFAVARSAFIARIDPGIAGNLAINLGFSLIDGLIEAEIPELLQKKCS